MTYDLEVEGWAYECQDCNSIMLYEERAVDHSLRMKHAVFRKLRSALKNGNKGLRERGL